MIARIAAVGLLFATACGTQARHPIGTEPRDGSPAPTAAASASSAPCPAVEGGSADTHMFLKDVRAAAHDGFDRVVFEFEAPSGAAGAIPRYSLRSAQPPFTKDPSDEPMTVSGSAFLLLNLQGATGVDLSGDQYRQIYTGPKEMKPGLEVLEELEQQGDFEATVNWIFGLNQTTCPSVTTLSGPHRIVIDLPSVE